MVCHHDFSKLVLHHGLIQELGHSIQVMALASDVKVEADPILIGLDCANRGVGRVWSLGQRCVIVLPHTLGCVCIDRITLISLHKLRGATCAGPKMLSHVRMQVLVFEIDVDHAIENHVPLGLGKCGLCIERAARATARATELVDRSLAALGLARFLHGHRLKALLYIHLVLLQEKLQIGRATKLKRPLGGVIAVSFDL